MREWEPADWEREWESAPAPFALFVHTPLCGTCGVARRMLEVIGELMPDFPLHSANLNLMPRLAQRFQIESVPCLIVKSKDGTWNKIYRFGSVTEVAERLADERGKR